MAKGNTRLKKAIRHRMSQTGETYSTAMAQVLKQLEQGSKTDAEHVTRTS